MTVGELTGIPWSFTAHRYDIVARNLLAEKDHRAVFVRYISKSGQALASERVGYDTSERSYVLHMGVSLPPVTARLEGTHPSTFVCSASLTPVKGHRILIEAVAALRRAGLSCEVLLLGDGPLRNELAEQVASAGLQGCVRFLGQLPHNEVLSLYSTGIITAAVLPSLDLGGGLHEGIPVSLIEAMSYGVPVIGTSTGGIPELLGGGAGVLVPPANANALAQAMQQLIEHPEYRAELGVAARRRVNESFNIEVVCSKLEELFDCPTRATDERTAVPLS
jgi:glycosyltransferase involved in cell wall biosynthesis